jgi:hypothetical protein
MDFRPTNVHFAYNPDGSKTRIETWDYDTIAGWELLGNFMNLIIMVFMFCLVSPFLLFLAIADFNGRFNVLTPVGAIVGSLVIYDAMHGTFFITLLNLFLPEWLMTVVVTLNVIAVITHIFLMIFGVLTHKFIVKWYETERARINVFVVIMLIVISFSKLYAGSLFEEGWMKTNIDRNQNTIKLEIEQENKQREYNDSISNLEDENPRITENKRNLIDNSENTIDYEQTYSGESEGDGGQRPGL